MKKFFLLLVIAACIWACKIESIGFTIPSTARDTLFSAVITQARERGMVSKNAYLTGDMDVYRVCFREQRVAESNVMEWRMISENDPRYNSIDSDCNSGQNLYIYLLHMSDQNEDIFVYFSLAVMADSFCTGKQYSGAGHAYLGKLDTKDSIHKINFYERLDFKQNNNVSKLVPEKKSARRKDDGQNEHTMFGNMLTFTLKNQLSRGCDTLCISEITVLELNKTGGNNPVFYPVDTILGQNSLLMKKQ